MDPDQALADFLDALNENDRAGALDALDDLTAWIRNAGFLPIDPRAAS